MLFEMRVLSDIVLTDACEARIMIAAMNNDQLQPGGACDLTLSALVVVIVRAAVGGLIARRP